MTRDEPETVVGGEAHGLQAQLDRQCQVAADLSERRKEVGDALTVTSSQIAETESHLADTFDRLAETRPDRADRLHQMAADARERARIESNHSRQHPEDDRP